MTDYYKILGVAVNATISEIKKNYRDLAKKLHPDVSNSPTAKEDISLVNEAYSVLSDNIKRVEYDRDFANFVKQQSFQGADPAEFSIEQIAVHAYNSGYVRGHNDAVIKSQITIDAYINQIYNLQNTIGQNEAIIEALKEKLGDIYSDYEDLKAIIKSEEQENK